MSSLMQARKYRWFVIVFVLSLAQLRFLERRVHYAG